MLGDETGIHSEPCTEVHPLPRETEARTEEARPENSAEASTEARSETCTQTCTAARPSPCSEAGATAGACPGTRTVEGIPELPRRLERLGAPDSKQ